MQRGVGGGGGVEREEEEEEEEKEEEDKEISDSMVQLTTCIALLLC